jgi:hypothetical protein
MADVQFPLGADAGIESISGSQTVEFQQYVRVILPLDGFVFWVKADLLSQSAIAGAVGINRAGGNQARGITNPTKTILARGSLHISARKRQEETETYGVHGVTFTSEEPLHQGFNEIDETHIYIGTFGRVRFAFSDRQNFYVQAGLWHYIGNAIYPWMETQIIDAPGALMTRELIVSNSLSLWLGLNNNIPFYGFGNLIPLYPSYLVQPNIRPPFGTIHIVPDSTQVLSSIPTIGFRSDHSQLVKEHVRVVLYGINNDEAMTFVDAVNQFSSDYNLFGLMGNPPVIRDEKMSQDELSIIAQKKSVEFDVSYYQNSVRDIARQIIGQAIPTFITVSPTFRQLQ